MRNQAVVSTCFLVVLCLVANSGGAEPIYFADTEHYYERIDIDLNWDDAKADAESRSYLGITGHLATITSQAENDFITSNFLAEAPSPAYCGGYQPPGSGEPNQGWLWVTGEPWDFENWDVGEPNNFGGNEEDCVELYSTGVWNDATNSSGRSCYIAEYPAGPIPEPSILILVSIGGLGLLSTRKIRHS